LNHLAYDYRRQVHIQNIIDGLQRERPKPDAKALAAKKTTTAMEPGALATLLLGLID